MKLVLLLPLTIVTFIVLFLMHLSEADANVLPTIWNGKCTPIHKSPYMTVNPTNVNPYQKGYIPPTMTSTWIDIPDSCFPKVTAGGPK